MALLSVWLKPNCGYFPPLCPSVSKTVEVNCMFTGSRGICKTGGKNGRAFVCILTETGFGCFQTKQK